MIIKGKDIHDAICKFVPDFDDADLYNSIEEYHLPDGCVDDIVEQSIKYGGSLSYISIDDSRGHQIIYRNLNLKANWREIC